MPTTSFPVVIKGPVAIAGSIPNFSRIIGTEVPIKAATITVSYTHLTLPTKA